jgi:hypothetical protein
VDGEQRAEKQKISEYQGCEFEGGAPIAREEETEKAFARRYSYTSNASAIYV